MSSVLGSNLAGLFTLPQQISGAAARPDRQQKVLRMHWTWVRFRCDSIADCVTVRLD
jgi:hypothetical protein